MRRRTHFAAAGLLAAAPLVIGAAHPWADKVGPGEVAPEIDGQVWFNHIGRAPTLASLRGHTVLLEFWATW